MEKFESVDDYLASFPHEIKLILEAIRKTILTAAPRATESISYGMPSYKYLKKQLIFFGAFRKHIGLFATPEVHTSFSKGLSKYKQGKGSVQFPFSNPIPLHLIEQMVIYKMKQIENLPPTSQKSLNPEK